MSTQHDIPLVAQTPDDDAVWAAGQAIAALRQGRYELGAGFAAIAARAHRAQHASGHPMLGGADRAAGIDSMAIVPFLGQTRDEQPSRPLDGYAGFGPTGNGDADLAAAAGLLVLGGVGADTVTTMQIPTGITETRPIPRTGRCHEPITSDGGDTICWAVITFNDQLQRWVHAFAHPAGPYGHDAVAGPEAATR